VNPGEAETVKSPPLLLSDVPRWYRAVISSLLIVVAAIFLAMSVMSSLGIWRWATSLIVNGAAVVWSPPLTLRRVIDESVGISLSSGMGAILLWVAFRELLSCRSKPSVADCALRQAD
jgi:hypothetical protein